MIVRVHSLGSLWQTKDLPNGGTRVWNTTGIRDGCRVRSCATLFGQLVLGPKAKPLLRDLSCIRSRNWVASEITQSATSRNVRLACPAESGAGIDWHLTALNEQLVGVVPPDGLDPDNILVLSASQRRQQQELLLLVKPFAWLAGPTGSAIFEVTDRCIGRWNIRGRWSLRYSKDSIVISETADKPILRTVYEAGHVTLEQLHCSLHPYATSRAERNSLAWRVRRLVRHGFLESRRVEGMEPALSLGESGELYLQSFDGAIVERRTRSKGGNARSQVWHDVQLFTIQLALRRAGVVLTWQSEAEVRAQNRVASLRFAKEYDAVVTFRLGEVQADVALEFERTVKSADAYLRIFSQLKEETLLTRFLYLVPDSKSQLLLRDVAPRHCPRIYTALTHEFRALPATAGLLDLRCGQTVTLADCLS